MPVNFFLRLENVRSWKDIINGLSYEFEPNHQILTELTEIWPIYNKLNSEYKADPSIIDLVYKNQVVSKLYSEEELDNLEIAGLSRL